MTLTMSSTKFVEMHPVLANSAWRIAAALRLCRLGMGVGIRVGVEAAGRCEYGVSWPRGEAADAAQRWAVEGVVEARRAGGVWGLVRWVSARADRLPDCMVPRDNFP